MLQLVHILALLLLIVGCSGAASDGQEADSGAHDAGLLDASPQDAAMPPAERDLRRADAALVQWLRTDPDELWWLEERLARWPVAPEDRDPGPRRIVRMDDEGEVHVVFEAATDSLVDAVLHPSGQWSGIAVDDARRPVLLRGDRDGVLQRRVLDDPALPDDHDAWLDQPPDALRVSVLSASSPAIAAVDEGIVVALMSEDSAVLAYRLSWRDGDFVAGPRSLVTPAVLLTPFLPIGGSYDNFDAMVAWFLVQLAVDEEGRAVVAHWVSPQRLQRHNAVFDTSLTPLRRDAQTGERPSDVLVTQLDTDGGAVFSRVVGTDDVDDELYSLAVSDAGIAAVGRSRRERGLDNTEWHVMVARLQPDGTVLPTVTWDADASGIAQTAAFAEDGALWVGGTEGWRQNPSGFSLSREGRPFLLRLDGAGQARAFALPDTSGHAELRALELRGERALLGGFERGPLTHTGDEDPARIRSDLFLWERTREP